IGVRAGELEKLDLVVGDELLYHRRIPRREQGRRIDLTGEQLIGCLFGRERKQLDLVIHLIELEQTEKERMRAAAHRSDRDLPAAKVGKCRARQPAAVEDPQRLVE